jgi:hypothetical protein
MSYVLIFTTRLLAKYLIALSNQRSLSRVAFSYFSENIIPNNGNNISCWGSI